MPGQKRMTLKERNKHLENMQAAYRQASRKEKGLLLSHLEQVTGLGRKPVRRRFDTAQTRFERLCATGVMPAQEQREWRQWRHSINPRQLRRDIYHQIEVLFSLPGLAPGAGKNVRDSLTITAKKGGRVSGSIITRVDTHMASGQPASVVM